MKYWIYDIGDQPEWRVPVEANHAGHAAQLFAEKGARGVHTICDEDGNPTKWDLKAITVHYAYPVHQVGDG